MNKLIKYILFMFVLLFLIVSIVNAAQIVGYFVVEPEKANNTNISNEKNIGANVNTEKNVNKEIPPVTSSIVKEPKEQNSFINSIKNLFSKIFSFFKR